MRVDIKKKYRSLLRYKLNCENKHKLNIEEWDKSPVSIISSNCVGGVIYHELGLKFYSPTINLFFEPDDYLKFIDNIEKYTNNFLIKEIPQDDIHYYPRGVINNDIIIHFLHYSSFSEAVNKWNERCKRINYNNMIFLLSERDGLKKRHVDIFRQMKLKGKKVLLSCNDFGDDFGDDCIVHNMGSRYKDNVTNQLIDLCAYKSKFSGKRYIDDFDYVSMINSVYNN